MRDIKQRAERLRRELNWRGHSIYSRDNWSTPTAQRALARVESLRNEVRALEALSKD